MESFIQKWGGRIVTIYSDCLSAACCKAMVTQNGKKVLDVQNRQGIGGGTDKLI